MLWVPKRIVSMWRFFWALKTYAKNYGFENIYNFTLKTFVYLNLCNNKLFYSAPFCIYNFHIKTLYRHFFLMPDQIFFKFENP